MLGKFNFLCSFHIWVSFLKIYGFNDYNKFHFLACEQLTCLCIIYPTFVVIEKFTVWDQVLKLHWILNVIWVIDISGWLSSLQFLSVTLLLMEIKPRLFYQVLKILSSNDQHFVALTSLYVLKYSRTDSEQYIINRTTGIC